MQADRAKTLVVTPEGWEVQDLNLFRLCVDHPPPRHHAYLYQLREDLKGWPTLALWVVGIGLVGLGWAIGQWLLAALGMILFVIWFRLFRLTVRNIRDSPLAVGMVESLGPHPLMRGGSTANAQLKDGQVVPVVLSNEPATQLIQEQGRIEVLFLDDHESEYALVLGVRAVR